jgi:hypothetical protein
MPTNNPYISPIGSGSTAFDRAALLNALQANGVLPFETLAQVRDLIAGTLRAVLVSGRVWHQDAADAVTPDDGVTTIRSFDNKCFKAVGTPRIESVTAVLNDPPGSPALAASWLVGPAPSAAWAAQANALAIWTALGWQFVTPAVGMLVYVQATGAFRHYTNTAVWQDGVGALTTTAGSVAPASLLWPLGVTVQATQNTPPGSVAGAYIVGSAPTGAWSSQAGKVAVAVASAWQFLTPYEGASVWDVSAAERRSYRSGVWTLDTRQGSISKRIIATTANIDCGTLVPASPPTTSSGAEIALFASHAVKKVGNILVFRIVNERVIDMGNGGGVVAQSSPGRFMKSLHVDGAVSAASYSFDSAALSATPADTASHSYRIRLHSENGSGIARLPPSLIELEEVGT